ncbi:MAG: beta-lactamase family protein [Bacteroidetes bacterium]|nr:beta-lactamase family protein [Bacteroidota bacterium]MBS1776446.1 beta-lactamase family protein [Bacteroidota bacterium]
MKEVQQVTKAICNKGFSGNASIMPRLNFGACGQESSPQSLTAYSLNRCVLCHWTLSNNSRMIKPFCFFLISLLFLTSSYGQSKHDRKLSKSLDELIPKRLKEIAPGCVVLIAKDNKVVYKKAFGMANTELNIPMQPNMLFRTGSMGKQYTAIGILQLVEQGKISLQDSIQKYIKNFPSKGYTITIENLLTNTSGIKDYLSEISNPSKQKETYTPKEGVDYIKDEPLNFKPGSEFRYSNSNYYLLGYIIEMVTGKTFENYLKENVLDPADLKNTFYIHPEKNIPDMPQGYSKFDGKIEKANLQEVTIMYSAGALISNADDIYKWHEALYNQQLVKKETLEKATTAFQFPEGTFSEYGYGWFIKNIDGSKTIEHSGSTDGFQSDEIYLPNENVFIVTLFNCYEADMDWQLLTNDIARLAIGKPLNDEVKLSESILKAYVGTYEVNLNNINHKLIVTFTDGRLSVEASNPDDRLPKVFLYAKSENEFYMKEAPLRFEFVKDSNNVLKIITYNNRGKDAEWTKTQ